MSPVCLEWMWWERAVASVAEGALAVGVGLMASGLWPAVNRSRRGDTLAVLCGSVNPGLLAELVQSKLKCSEKPFRHCSIPQLRAVMLRTACCCLSPISAPNSSAAGLSFACRESCGVGAALVLCSRRPVERKGTGKSTTQSRAVKLNCNFRKEEKVNLTAFPVPKA